MENGDASAEASVEDVYEGFTRMNLGEHSSADALRAHELNQLSVQERNMINDEIHGIHWMGREETPELLRCSLVQLASEVDRIPTKPAYEASLAFPDSYVHKDEFRLLFLRTEYFDAKKSAERMVNYLDVIRWSFGDKALQRDIRIEDFDEEGLKYLRQGYHQLLPGMDRSGRRVGWSFVATAHSTAQVPVKNRVQTSIYLLMQMVKNNVSAQQKGMVLIIWTHGYQLEDLKRRSWVHKKLIGAVPLRWRAMHYCFSGSNENFVRLASSVYMLALGPEGRQRVRFHIGSATECMYKLQTFGIQSLMIPINTNTGTCKLANHHKWLELQRRQEEAEDGNVTFNGIGCPEQEDVLFGRGWPKMSHPGNAVFRSTIESRLEEYNAAESKRDKTMIAWSIVCELRDSGARFLREDRTGWWVEVSNEVARQKVSIGFRDIRKARNKASRSTNSLSGNGMLSSKRKVPDQASGNSSEEDVSNAFLNLDGSKRPRQPCKACGLKCEESRT